MSPTNHSSATGRIRHSAGYRAAGRAKAKNTLLVTLPGMGSVRLPPPEQLAYLAGIAVLTALEIIEWPVAVALATGHILAEQRRNKMLHDFGEALEQA